MSASRAASASFASTTHDPSRPSPAISLAGQPPLLTSKPSLSASLRSLRDDDDSSASDTPPDSPPTKSPPLATTVPSHEKVSTLPNGAPPHTLPRHNPVHSQRPFVNAQPLSAPLRRSVAAPLLPSTTVTSTSPGAMDRAGAAPGPDAMARQPSLESAESSQSSLTSGVPSVPPAAATTSISHSHQSSTDTITASAPDAASLIASVGTPTAAVELLFKERRALTVRNEQLWKLVEKQRAMVHGLHEDLQRALKDKERYRKRLKDLQAAAPPVPPLEATPSSPKDKRRSREGPSGHNKMPSIDSVTSGSALSRPGPSSPPLSPNLSSQRAEPAPLNIRPAPLSPNDKGTPSHPPHAPSASESTVDPARSPLTPRATQENVGPPPSAEKNRKSAPAPLNLTQASPTYVAQIPQNAQVSPSDYGEGDSPVEAISLEERGRRRTREDDDREREAVVLAEEARSRSEKNMQSKSKSKPREEELLEHSVQTSHATAIRNVDVPAGLALGIGLPSSPRAQMLGGIQSPLQPSLGSIASALAPEPPFQRAIPQSVSLPPKSPGLPMSPRPGDRPMNAAMPRMPANDAVGPGPLSPRAGLPLSPRAPKHPIPMPGETTTMSSIPNMSRTESKTSQHSLSSSMAERLQSGFGTPTIQPSVSSPTSPTAMSNNVFRGFMTEQYPGKLLTPTALPLVRVRVFSSRLRPSRHSFVAPKSSDDEVFTLGVHLRSDGKQLWRVEKQPSALPALDQIVRCRVKLPVSLPDKSIFNGHAPTKVDNRRATLNKYFDALLDTPLDEAGALAVCDFFSRQVIDPDDESSSPFDQELGETVPGSPRPVVRKEGYLAKKGKSFGGWKSRYFVLENGQLRHFESPNGAPLGIIRLQNAQIAKQNASTTADDAEFRHAFMILEPKRKDSSSLVRHVLCAESDEERDGWVDALMHHVAEPNRPVEEAPSSPKVSQHSPKTSRSESFRTANEIKRRQQTKDSFDAENQSQLHSVPYYQTVAAEAPKVGMNSLTTSSPSPLVDETPHSAKNPSGNPAISGPVGGGPIQNAHAWGNRSPSPARGHKDKDKDRKRSMFGFIRGAGDEPRSGARGVSPRPPTGRDHPGRGRPVFGVPLAEAAETSQPLGLSVCLPSPVHRCIEYLDARNACMEEGLFRISGANTTTKALQARFDTEGDVQLLDGEYMDVHAIASLLKTYFRELPENVLTATRLPDFLKVISLENKTERLAAINFLIHQLPEPNREVLVALSRYLIKVVQNAEFNKMTIKNVCIVFAPTLNIPTPLVALFLTDYDQIFTPSPTDPVNASSLLNNLTNPLTGGHLNSGLDSHQQPLYSEEQQQYGQQAQRRPLTHQNNSSSSTVKQGGANSAPNTPLNSTRRQRQSPSPASRYRALQSTRTTTPPSRTTPPPSSTMQDYALDPPVVNPGLAPPSQSSASSSPRSFLSSQPGGRDSPNADGSQAHVQVSGSLRKNRRESAMLGGGQMGGAASLAPYGSNAATADSQLAEVRQKNVYTRLRDTNGMAGVREEE